MRAIAEDLDECQQQLNGVQSVIMHYELRAHRDHAAPEVHQKGLQPHHYYLDDVLNTSC